VGLARLAEHRLTAEGIRVRTVHVRDLPAEALLRAEFADPKIREASAWVAEADGVIAVSPVYKAAYTGAFKAFIDLLPQFGLRGKVVLPLLVGGSAAHVLAIDYAIRPMLQSLDPCLIVGGLFLVDKTVEWADDGVRLTPEVATRFAQTMDAFVEGLRAHGTTGSSARRREMDLDPAGAWPM